MKTNLNNLVKENLIKTKEKKILLERKIVKERIDNIVNFKKLKTKKDIKLAGYRLFLETIKMEDEKINKKIIREQLEFLDLIKGGISSGPLQILKETIVKGILDFLGVPSTGFWPDVTAIFVGNLDFVDIPKLADCKFFTHILSKSVIETFLKKLIESKTSLGDGFMVSSIRSIIIDALDENVLTQKLSNSILDQVCKFNLKEKLMKFFSILGWGKKPDSGDRIDVGSSLAALSR